MLLPAINYSQEVCKKKLVNNNLNATQVESSNCGFVLFHISAMNEYVAIKEKNLIQTNKLITTEEQTHIACNDGGGEDNSTALHSFFRKKSLHAHRPKSMSPYWPWPALLDLKLKIVHNLESLFENEGQSSLN